MDDPLLMRGLKRIGDLLRDRQRLVQRQRPTRDPPLQILAFDEFEDKRRYASGLFNPVNVRDVRMIKRGEDLRFAAEARETVGIVGDGRPQDFDCDVAIQLRVASTVDLAHSARANGGKDLVWAKARAGGKGQAHIVVPGTGPLPESVVKWKPFGAPSRWTRVRICAKEVVAGACACTRLRTNRQRSPNLSSCDYVFRKLEGLAGATPWRFESSLPHHHSLSLAPSRQRAAKSGRPVPGAHGGRTLSVVEHEAAGVVEDYEGRQQELRDTLGKLIQRGRVDVAAAINLLGAAKQRVRGTVTVTARALQSHGVSPPRATSHYRR